MSTKEKAYNIIEHLTEEQLKGFIMMFENLIDTVSDNEITSRIKDIENGENTSGTFNSISELMEDLDAEN